MGNGTLSDFAGSGVSYSFNVTPTSEGAVTVDVAADVAQDASGNNNVAASQLAITYDVTSPSISIAWSVSSPTNVSPIPVTVSFSETVSGFETGDLTLVNSSVSNLSGSDTEYSFNLTPSGDGGVSVELPSGTVQDAAGN